MSGTILVVEDDDDIRDCLELVLSGEGYRVITAGNGRQALERLRAEPPPDLILLDLMMPELSGEEFLRELEPHSELAAVPILVLSAWAADVEALGPRVHGFIRKPLALEELLAAVAHHTGGPGAA